MIKISILTSLYKCEKYLDDFFNNVNLISNLTEIEFVFIHNAPSLEERKIIFEHLNKNKNINYQYMEVEREPLYKSWNRGIMMSKGTFIAVWNVDDVRYPNSLKIQEQCLSDDISAGLVYGNFDIKTNKGIRHIELPDVSCDIGLKKFQNGSFIMWRKSVHDIIGCFDDQLFIVGDQDFWYRISSSFKIIKTSSNLGLFLFSSDSALSSNSKRNSLERCLIVYRYGFWSPVNLLNYRKFRRYYDGRHLHFLDTKAEIKCAKMTLSPQFLITFLKSVIMTLLFAIYPNHKRFIEGNF